MSQLGIACTMEGRWWAGSIKQWATRWTMRWGNGNMCCSAFGVQLPAVSTWGGWYGEITKFFFGFPHHFDHHCKPNLYFHPHRFLTNCQICHFRTWTSSQNFPKNIWKNFIHLNAFSRVFPRLFTGQRVMYSHQHGLRMKLAGFREHPRKYM